jgi:hypothetical protein
MEKIERIVNEFLEYELPDTIDLYPDEGDKGLLDDRFEQKSDDGVIYYNFRIEKTTNTPPYGILKQLIHSTYAMFIDDHYVMLDDSDQVIGVFDSKKETDKVFDRLYEEARKRIKVFKKGEY